MERGHKPVEIRPPQEADSRLEVAGFMRRAGKPLPAGASPQEYLDGIPAGPAGKACRKDWTVDAGEEEERSDPNTLSACSTDLEEGNGFSGFFHL